MLKSSESKERWWTLLGGVAGFHFYPIDCHKTSTPWMLGFVGMLIRRLKRASTDSAMLAFIVFHL